MTFTPINVLITVLWLLVVILVYSEYCYIWQLKEYRWDRFKDFLATKRGKKYWMSNIQLVRAATLLVVLFWPLNQIIYVKFILIGLLTTDLTYHLIRLLKRKLLRPKITKKILLIFLLSVCLESFLIIIIRDWTLVFLLLTIRLFLIAFSTILVNQFTTFIKKIYIQQAEKKLKKYEKLMVIGITGSYGKTTVKTFLTHILSAKFVVASTPKNINTEIGIAKFILQTDFQNIDIFVVEMGAYNIGEIKLICDMVHPAIGVLTAINEQHLSLFGSIENTQTAKYELLRSLPKTGLAIVNSDNKYCRQYLDDLKMRVKTFGQDIDFDPDLLITDVYRTNEGMEFKGIVNSNLFTIQASTNGFHNAMNIAPCILIGLHLGMKIEDINKECKTLQMPRGTLRQYQYGSCTIIDDSYNSNPEGFKSALHLLSSFPSDRQRLVITRGMLELGEKSTDLHIKIGEEISFTADELVLISKDYEKPLRAGVGEKYRTQIVVKENPAELLEYIQSLKNKNCVILLENRIPTILYNEMIPR